MAHCPECGGLIDLESLELEEGESVTCPECNVELEVVNRNPVELSAIQEEEEEDEEKEDEESADDSYSAQA